METGCLLDFFFFFKSIYEQPRASRHGTLRTCVYRLLALLQCVGQAQPGSARRSPAQPGCSPARPGAPGASCGLARRCLCLYLAGSLGGPGGAWLAWLGLAGGARRARRNTAGGPHQPSLGPLRAARGQSRRRLRRRRRAAARRAAAVPRHQPRPVLHGGNVGCARVSRHRCGHARGRRRVDRGPGVACARTGASSAGEGLALAHEGPALCATA